MKTQHLLFLLLINITQTSFAQFIVKEADFEWFPLNMKSNRCAIEAVVPRSDGGVEINTFTQTSASVMVQTGVLAGSVGGYQHYPLMNTKRFDAQLKLQNESNDFYNYRIFIPRDKQEKKSYMMLADRISENVEVPIDSNYLQDMMRKYPQAVKRFGEGAIFYRVWNNDPPEDKENKFIGINADSISDYDARANVYLRQLQLPTAFINPVIDRKGPEGKRTESFELLISQDKNVLQRYAFVSPTGDEDKWAMYKHRIIVTYDKNGNKVNELPVTLDFARKESYVSEIRNVEDNTTNGFLYIYHRVLGLSKKNQDSVLGNYEAVYVDKAGNKQFQYTFKITEKANHVNPFISYARGGKIHLITFGHPDGKTMAVTSFVLSPTGVENIQSILLNDWKVLISGAGVNISSWTDDGFLLQDIVQDKNGFVYLIGEKRTKSSLPGDPAMAAGANPMPIPIHVYPSHLIFVMSPDDQLVRQHVIGKPTLAESIFEKTYELISNDQGVFLIYKDRIMLGMPKPFHSLFLSNRTEIQKNVEPHEYTVRIAGLNGTALNEYTLPVNLYHSKIGWALDQKKQNVYLIGISPASIVPKLFKITLW
jgi:hypothetical protein